MIFTFASLKGGTVKTSLAIFLAQAWAYDGKRVLAVDLDHNNNLTDYYFRDSSIDNLAACNVQHVLNGKATPDQAIRPVGLGIDVMPCTPELARSDAELMHDPGALLQFSAKLRKLDYDIIVLDTPPALSLPLAAALYAANVIVCPVAMSRWTIQGYQLLAEQVERVGERRGVVPRLLACPSIVSDLEAENLKGLDHWASTHGIISRQVSVKTAGTNGRALKAETRAWQQYADLAWELMA
jgi:chromosome partitioning protein